MIKFIYEKILGKRLAIVQWAKNPMNDEMVEFCNRQNRAIGFDNHDGEIPVYDYV
jgi:hypothetical protein